MFPSFHHVSDSNINLGKIFNRNFTILLFFFLFSRLLLFFFLFLLFDFLFFLLSFLLGWPFLFLFFAFFLFGSFLFFLLLVILSGIFFFLLLGLFLRLRDNIFIWLLNLAASDIGLKSGNQGIKDRQCVFEIIHWWWKILINIWISLN